MSLSKETYRLATCDFPGGSRDPCLPALDPNSTSNSNITMMIHISIFETVLFSTRNTCLN